MCSSTTSLRIWAFEAEAGGPFGLGRWHFDTEILFRDFGNFGDGTCRQRVHHAETSNAFILIPIFREIGI